MQSNNDDRNRLITEDDDDVDDNILSGTSNFVPAMRHDHNDDDEEAYKIMGGGQQHRQQDEVVLLSNAPITGGAFTYFVFYLLGIGTMTPWNFFVNAEEYWKYKFRNTSLNDTNSLEEELTPLQKSFTCDLTLTATISGTTFLILNAIYGQNISLRVKMLGTLWTILVFFGVTTAFVEVNTDGWQEQFFLITLITVVVLNISAATMSGALYGVAGLFPSEYMTAVVSGQALGGIMTALALILVLAFGAAPNTTAFIYFIMGSILMFICILCYMAIARQEYFQYYLNGGDKYKVISARPSHSAETEDTGVPLEPILRQVLAKIYVPTVAMAVLYATTLSVYPAVTILMQSENFGNHSEWTDVYYLPVVNYLFFNCGDYIGRLFAGWFERPSNANTTLLFTIARMLFVPFILCSNSSEHQFMPVLVKHDVSFIIMIITFAISNGYLTNILLTMVPRRVKQHEKELASSIMAASLSCGMTLGSMLSMAFIQML